MMERVATGDFFPPKVMCPVTAGDTEADQSVSGPETPVSSFVSVKNFTSKICSNFVKFCAMAKWHTILVVNGQIGSPMVLERGEERTPKQEDGVGVALADAREHSCKLNSDTPGVTPYLCSPDAHCHRAHHRIRELLTKSLNG